MSMRGNKNAMCFQIAFFCIFLHLFNTSKKMHKLFQTFWVLKNYAVTLRAGRAASPYMSKRRVQTVKNQYKTFS